METPEPQPETVEQPQKPKFKEGQVLSVNYTVRGPVRVVWRDGAQAVEEQKPNPDFVLPVGLSRKDTVQFIRLCLLIDQIVLQKDRRVPLMMQEAEVLMPKTVLKKFRNQGLVEIETLRMERDRDEKGRRDVRSHAFCWLTPDGMGLRDALHEAARIADQQAKADAEARAKLAQDPEHQKRVQEIEGILDQIKLKPEGEQPCQSEQK